MSRRRLLAISSAPNPYCPQPWTGEVPPRVLEYLALDGNPHRMPDMPPSDATFDGRILRLRSHVIPLQRDLRAALAAVLPADAGSRSCARALGVSRSLAWGCWNLAAGPDLASAIRALPGAKGWTLILEGFERCGCPPTTLHALRKSVEAVEREMRSGRVAPSLLRSMAAGGLDTDRETRRIRMARRRARESAETLYGIRAHACVAGLVAGPPNRRGMVDLAGVSLFDGLERLRPGPAWPIFEGMLLSRGERPRTRPLCPSAIPGVLDEFCTPGAAGVELRPSGSKHHLVSFVAQADAKAKPVRAAFGQLTKSAGSVTAPTRRRSGAPIASHHLGVIATLPLRLAIFDMFLHRDIPMQGEPVGALYGPPDPWPVRGIEHGEPDRLEAKRLPLDSDVVKPRVLELPSTTASLSEPWTRLVRLAIEAIGTPAADFRHFRLVLRDPPMHGRLMMRWSTG